MKSSVVNYCLTNAVPLPTDPTLLAPLLELLELLELLIKRLLDLSETLSPVRQFSAVKMCR
jgi:hypothetical protein